jgi:predicted transcriptional regulator YheO
MDVYVRKNRFTERKLNGERTDWNERAVKEEEILENKFIQHTRKKVTKKSIYNISFSLRSRKKKTNKSLCLYYVYS